MNRDATKFLPKESYRQELDGLRAIAVLAVIIYHAELSWRGMILMPGGFLGVDIFFVLSGFLITGILIDRSPSLIDFYKRRFDRIYPALLLLLFLSCIAAYKILQPSDLLSFVESLKGALGFYSNYVLMYEEPYTSDASKYKALIHTWSLGVEWQFYIVFPIIIYTLKKYLPANIEKVIVFLCLISFLYCLYLMGVNSDYSFYSTVSRVWQLCAGGIVFFISKRLKDSAFDRYLSALGLIIIFSSFLFFKDTDNHPGFVSLSAVIGAAFFILFTRPGSILYFILTLRVFVFFGVISYSLYLYHQPVFVFYRLGFADINGFLYLIGFPFVVFISYLSYRFFEKPLRRIKSNKKYFLILFLFIANYLFASLAENTEGFPDRHSEQIRNELVHFQSAEFERLKSSKLGLLFNGKETYGCNNRIPRTACEIGDQGDRLVISGDSFSGVFTYILTQEMSDTSIISYHYDECPLLSDPIWFSKRPECWEINKLRWIELREMKPTYILLGANYNLFGGGKKSIENFILGKRNLTDSIVLEDVYKSYRKTVETLVGLGYKPIILLQPPNPVQDVKAEMKRKVYSGVKFDKEYFGVM